MKIVVTGATGFVGKSLIKKLNQKSFLTVAVGRKLTHSNANEFIVLSDFSEKNIWQQRLINCLVFW